MMRSKKNSELALVRCLRLVIKFVLCFFLLNDGTVSIIELPK